jgi:hypothetical protein
VIAVPVVVACVAAGIGWLYLLRNIGALDVGPTVPGALPLQRLAGNAGQPLLRMAVAWVPMGIVAGLALRATGIRWRLARAAIVAVVALALLVSAGAASDAVTSSSRFRTKISIQFNRPGTWAAAGLMVIGSLAVGPGQRRRRGWQRVRGSAPTVR